MIKSADVEWVDPPSHDHVGAVFTFKNDYYRAVKADKVDYVRKLFDADVPQMLTDCGFLAPTKISKLELEGFDLVLETQTADFRVTPHNFTREMLRTAADLWIQANLILEPLGYGIIDGHLGNFLLFNNCQPKWIDFGSIIPLQGWLELNPVRFGTEELLNYFVNPLWLAAHRPDAMRIWRSMLHRFGIELNEVNSINPIPFTFKGKTRVTALNNLKEVLQSIDFPKPKTDWSYYGNDRTVSLTAVDLSVSSDPGVDNRRSVILQVLKNITPTDETVMDVGGNDGYFTAQSALMGYKSLLCEMDEFAPDSFYNWSRMQSPEKVKCGIALGDAMHLSEAAGLVGDTTMALALTHHLAIGQEYTFEQIAAEFSRYTRKRLITEYMPWGLGMQGPVPDPLPSHYTLEKYLDALALHFSRVEVHEYTRPAHVHPRSLIICHK